MARIRKTTHAYKVLKGCRVETDVHAEEGVLRPGVVWIHGGALIGGHRGGISSEELEMYLGAGFAVVSIDYRLAPETRIEGILEDVEDAFTWIRGSGRRLGVDRERLGVVGHSAGGYLALVSGHRVHQPPKALVSFYGYGDILGDWYSRPDDFYCEQPRVSEAEARAAVGEREISEASAPNNRGRYYLYLRQRGLWPLSITGLDPELEPHAFKPFMPIENVSRDYPPTLLLHGTDDTDVPYEQSVIMGSALANYGVDHELITIQGGGHGFDRAKPRSIEVDKALARVISFLKERV